MKELLATEALHQARGAALLIKNDARGMSSLAARRGGLHLARAAAALGALHRAVPLNVCTGFPVGGAPETDGPAGALVLCAALVTLQHTTRFVSSADVLERVKGLLDATVECVPIPCGGPASPLDGMAVTIEICGRTHDGTYRNMRGADITAHAPWFETAIGLEALVAIGDGGNEFGMGVVEPAWFDTWNVRPPVSRCAHLIPAQVSNWGALGLVAALSRLTGQDLLPSAHGYNRLLEDLAAAGFVDGLSGEAAPTEDGHPPGAGGQVVDELRRWVAQDAGTAD